MTVAGTLATRKRAHRPREVSAPSSDDLLAWYDGYRRTLPWRARPGETPQPYRVWLSEIMLQQTTAKAVAPYYLRFLARFPTIAHLAEAPLEDVLKLWAGLGYYARARNLHACAKAVVERHGGTMPDTEAALATLPGIGTYTAAAIAAIAFDRPAVPVDGNVERVVTRLYAIGDELPAAKPKIRELAAALAPPRRAGDFAQALMDLGATICTPRSPACELCPWTDACAARRRSDQESFPRKTAKKTGALRRGAAFVAVRADGSVLVCSRPARGLLGGMTEVPTTDWTPQFDDGALEAAPLPGRWRRIPGVVTHVFTHFPLELAVYVAALPARAKAPPGMRFAGANELAGEAFPTVMRKVLTYAGLDREMRPRTKNHRLRRSRMTIERKEVGPRMSQVVIHGDTIYLAGVIARESGGKSVADQTREILATIDRHLAQAGSDKSKILSANIWLTDMSTFNEMNAVWDAWVSPGNTPARATVEAKLAAPPFKVEIMVVAAK